MSSVSDKLATAKAAPRPVRKVTVALTDALSERREQLAEELDRAKKSRGKDRAEAVARVEAELSSLLEGDLDSLLALKFTKLPGDTWAELTARCEPRIESPVDRQYGYNIHAVVKLAAQYVDGDGTCYGVSIEDGEQVPLIVTPAALDTPAVNEWADLFALLSGHEFSLIVDAIYRLNEYDPAQRVERLKKASLAATASGRSFG